MVKRGLVAALLIMMVGVGIISWKLYHAPSTLRIAVGPFGSEDTRMIAAFAQGLAREQSSFRLRTVITSGVAESARLVEDGKVDLAVIRPDIMMPTKADTVLITRRFFPVFVTSPESGIERIADLRGKRIGVVSPPEGNIDLLRIVLAQYEVAETPGMIVPMVPGEISESVRDERVDAIFAVGATGARGISAGMENLRRAWGTDPRFIPVREADAIAARHRMIETGEIVRGAFGGDPPRPAEALPTISVTHRIVASQSLSDSLVGDLTRELLNQRAVLAPAVPSVQGLEAPNTDKDAPLPVHKGAAAFLDGEQETFFDRYGDIFYIGVMALSLFGSTGAAMWSRSAGRRRVQAMEGIARLRGLIDTARITQDHNVLDEMLREADDVVFHAITFMTNGDIDETGVQAYRLVLDQLHRAIIERRHELDRKVA
jgi:TRAP transporter TAXI family solute receptor